MKRQLFNYNLWQKLKARLGIVDLGSNLFLGYCKIHKKYYVDRKHTNGEIRCPQCDEKWLAERKEHA